MRERVTGRVRDQSAFRFMQEALELGPGFRVGVIGATGVVGETLIQVLHERNFPVGELHLYASPESEGRWIDTPYRQLCLEVLDKKGPPLLDFAFFAADRDVARHWGWRLARRGAIVIDKSSYFRDKDYAPLMVPEVNAEVIEYHRGIIASPNCTTVPLVMALAPLHKIFGLRRVVAVSFQSVSGAGSEGVTTLERELSNPKEKPSLFPHRIAYNVIPWIEEGRGAHSGEELKIIRETRRILKLPRLPVRVTAVRVPTMIGHAIAVHAEFRRTVNAAAARKALSEFPGITLMDDPQSGRYPTPLIVQGRDDVLVGRVRRDRWRRGLALWTAADNLRKGAATNAVQIAETLIALMEQKASL